MRTASLSLAVMSLALTACGSGSTPLLGRAETRDLTVSSVAAPEAVFASAVELDRHERQIAPQASAPTPPAPPATAEPTPLPEPAPTPEPEPEPKPEPVETPAAPPLEVAMAPIETSTIVTDAAPAPLTSGAATSLEPGQTITVLANPLAGGGEKAAEPDMPATTRRGGVMVGGGDCPRRGGGRGVIDFR